MMWCIGWAGILFDPKSPSQAVKDREKSSRPACSSSSQNGPNLRIVGGNGLAMFQTKPRGLINITTEETLAMGGSAGRDG